jgi:hypothetical protein
VGIAEDIEMDHVFEGTPRAEIRLEGRKVIRGPVTNDWASRLQWKVVRDGKVVATPPARAETTYEHPDPTPGAYEVVLEMWHYQGFKSGSLGKFIEISNKVSYQI